MKNIRSALAAGLLVIGGAAVASAQQTQSPAPRQQAHAQRSAHRRGMGGQFLRGIQLSAAEKANIKAVHQKYAAQMKTLRAQHQQGQQPTDAERTQMRQLMTAQRNDLRGALSPENQAKFDANIAKVKVRAEKRLAKGKPTARPPRSY